MEKIKRQTFEKWAEDNNWLQINEGSTPNGHQATFLTPSGSLIGATYDLDGNLFQIVIIGPPAPQHPSGLPPGFLKGPGFMGKG